MRLPGKRRKPPNRPDPLELRPQATGQRLVPLGTVRVQERHLEGRSARPRHSTRRSTRHANSKAEPATKTRRPYRPEPARCLRLDDNKLLDTSASMAMPEMHWHRTRVLPPHPPSPGRGQIREVQWGHFHSATARGAGWRRDGAASGRAGGKGSATAVPWSPTIGYPSASRISADKAAASGIDVARAAVLFSLDCAACVA